MIFRQLFEPISSTYTYLLGCETSRQAVLVDPVMPTWKRDLSVLEELGLTLALSLETHIHADHITSARRLKEETGCRIAFPATNALPCADLGVEHDRPVTVGSVTLHPLYTPGHTDDHFCYRIGDRVLTGDALLIDGCGRTDFQNGDARVLYRSVHEHLFVLPEDTLVYPAHDYHGRRVSSIAQERSRNPRLGGGKSLEAFLVVMTDLKLPYPKFIDYAVPGNRDCGACPADLPERLKQYCEASSSSPQG